MTPGRDSIRMRRSRSKFDSKRTVLSQSTTPLADRSQDIGTERHIPVTNPIERLNGEIKRRTEVVGIFPNENVITCLVGPSS